MSEYMNKILYGGKEPDAVGQALILVHDELDKFQEAEDAAKLYAEKCERLERIERELAEVNTNDAQAVDEFNAGYDAFKDGRDLDTAQMEYRSAHFDIPDYDQFDIGYAWAKFTIERNAALEAK